MHRRVAKRDPLSIGPPLRDAVGMEALGLDLCRSLVAPMPKQCREQHRAIRDVQILGKSISKLLPFSGFSAQMPHCSASEPSLSCIRPRGPNILEAWESESRESRLNCRAIVGNSTCAAVTEFSARATPPSVVHEVEVLSGRRSSTARKVSGPVSQCSNNKQEVAE